MALTSNSTISLAVVVFLYFNLHRVRGKTYVHPSANTSVVETASGFSLYYGRNFKVLQNLFSNRTYLLLSEQAQASGRDEILDILMFHDPLSNYSIDTPVPVGFLELLGNLNTLLGVSPSYICSPCVLQFLSQGLIPIVDTSSINKTLTFGAVFTSSYMSAGSRNGNNSVNFDCMVEEGPLKRAEWIKFLAAFFDLEERANYVYSLVESNYQCLNASTRIRSPKPLVAWLTYNGGVWTFSNENYKLQFNLDAGGLNLNSSLLGMSFNMSEESDVHNFYDVISTLDVAIDESIGADPFAYTLSDFAAAANISQNATQFPFLSNKRLWRYDKRVGENRSLDWFEGAVPQPQVVLADLIEVFYPTGGYNTTYMRNIALGEGAVNTSMEQCGRSMETRLEPTVLSCVPQVGDNKEGENGLDISVRK